MKKIWHGLGKNRTTQRSHSLTLFQHADETINYPFTCASRCCSVHGEKLLLWTNEHSFAIFSCHIFGAKSLKNIPEIMNILTSASICWVVGIRRRDVLLDGCFNLDVWGLVPSVSVLEQWKREWKAHCEVGYWGLHPWKGWMLILKSLFSTAEWAVTQRPCVWPFLPLYHIVAAQWAL